MVGVSTKKRYRIHQTDVIIASFYKFRDAEIYIVQRTMFEDGKAWVYFLKKLFTA